MSNGRDFTKVVAAARLHYENLKTDITNSKDRIEHIRLTALAQEAHNLYTDLLAFQVGLVYSHTNHVNEYFNTAAGEDAAAARETFNESEEPLDLPEFKSPYTPPQV